MKLWINIMAIGCSTLLFAACQNNNETAKNENKLDAGLINNPRTADGNNAANISSMATMDFADTAHDFGTMHEGEMASYEFKFKNNGKAPLLISNAAGSCGCTVPDYPHSPIEPGKEGIINVKFNSTGKTGLQNKSVNIFTNSTKGTHLLTIKAEVTEVKE